MKRRARARAAKLCHALSSWLGRALLECICGKVFLSVAEEITKNNMDFGAYCVLYNYAGGR